MTKFLLLYLKNALSLPIVLLDSSYCSFENVSLAPSMIFTKNIPLDISFKLVTLANYVSLTDLNY
jgi:hypothetical protein